MYSVRVSFLPSDGRRISQEEMQRSVGDLTFKLSWDGRYHVLLIDGFRTEEDGREYLKSLRSSFAWLLLARDVPVEAELTPQDVTYYEDPVIAAQNMSKSLGVQINAPVDGILDGALAAVVETTKQLRVMTFGAGNAFVTVPAQQALDTILQGSRFTGSIRLASDPKLCVALKLYGAYFTELSTTARFLTLIIALEALATPVQRPPAVLELVQRWKAEVDERLSQLDRDSEEAAALEILQSDVLFRRESGIRSQIRHLIASTLRNDHDVTTQTKIAMSLYDVRSNLVHFGTVDPHLLDMSTSDAKSLVLRVLLSRFLDLVQT